MIYQGFSGAVSSLIWPDARPPYPSIDCRPCSCPRPLSRLPALVRARPSAADRRRPRRRSAGSPAASLRQVRQPQRRHHRVGHVWLRAAGRIASLLRRHCLKARPYTTVRTYQGHQVSITVRPVGTRRFDWTYSVDGGRSVANTDDLADTRERAVDDAWSHFGRSLPPEKGRVAGDRSG